MKQAHMLIFVTILMRSINGGSKNSALPVNERLKKFTEGASDNELTALYFQFGGICSSALREQRCTR
jgi:hypothetical protein